MKWTGPLQDPPFWLDRNREITAAMEPPKMLKGAFVVACILALLALGLTFDQALGIAANTMNETGWGRFYRAFNLGGWKVFKGTSHDPDGTPRFWWRALGNKSSGDPQTCFYRAFRSLEEFFAEWVAWFVPKPGAAGSKGRYGKTGAEFWSGNEWFDDLIAAGYKGEVTKLHPDGSMHEHENIEHALLVFWAQHVIGTAVDGNWGPKSKAALAKWQVENGHPDTHGVLDEATLHALTQGQAGKTIKVALAALEKAPAASNQPHDAYTPGEDGISPMFAQYLGGLEAAKARGESVDYGGVQEAIQDATARGALTPAAALGLTALWVAPPAAPSAPTDADPTLPVEPGAPAEGDEKVA
jgi:hypothetical protein